VVAAGCAAPTAPADGTERTTAIPPSATTTTETATPEPARVECVVRAGRVPEEFASVTVQAACVEHPTDRGPCYSEMFEGPYKPTVTPLPTPSGQCERTGPVEVDLTELENGEAVVSDTPPA
jgi:hypothetical protein